MSFHTLQTLFLALLAHPVDVAPVSEGTLPERVVAIVGEALEQDASELPEHESRLVQLGAPAIVPLFELLVVGRVEVEDQLVRLDGPAEELILGALERLPHAGLQVHLQGLPTPLEAGELRASHLALGATGDAGDLALLIRLTTPEPADGGLSLVVRSGFGDAAAEILERHRGESWLVARHYEDVAPGLRAPLLRAAERAHMADEIDMLAGLLRVHPELDVLLLGQLARVGHPWTDDTGALESVRRMLLSHDEREVLAAVIALAAFEDGESVDALIGLLDGADLRLREHLNQTLVRATGRDMGGETERWLAWRSEASRWWETEAPGLIRDLWSEDRARAAAAVNELVQHPMYRREVEAELLASLDPARPELCALGCAVLGHLGSPRARGALEELAADRDEWVSNAAQEALEEISRRTRPEFTEPNAPRRR